MNNFSLTFSVLYNIIVERCKAINFYGNVLTEKQRDMMQQYFNMDLSLSEIADNFNITRQGVRDAVKRGETVLTELEEQIGFAGKYREIIEDAEKIKSLAQNINFYNSSYAVNGDVSKAATAIMELCDNISNL